jgi:hypothetical protein
MHKPATKNCTSLTPVLSYEQLVGVIRERAVEGPTQFTVTRDCEPYCVDAYVVPWDIEPIYKRLPFFAGFDSATRTVFVSEDIPRELRRYVMWHTVMCCDIHGNDRCQCRGITASEIWRVREDKRLAYVCMRIIFYESLVTHAPNTPELEDIRQSLDVLRKYIRQLQATTLAISD